MNDLQRRLSEAHEAAMRATTPAAMAATSVVMADLLAEQREAALANGNDLNAPRITSLDAGYSRAFRNLVTGGGDPEKAITLSTYIRAKMEGGSLPGEARELNEELGIGTHHVPLDLLDRSAWLNTETDATGQATQEEILPKLVPMMAASAVGFTTRAFTPGEHKINVITSVGSAQARARDEAASAQAWTMGTTTMKPKRITWYGSLTSEDQLRLPGLDAALEMSARMEVAAQVDKAVFLGNSGASGTDADTAGLSTVTNVVQEDVTQANKILGPGTLKAFSDLIDGVHASSMSDLMVVASVGADNLWRATDIEASNSGANVVTLSSFLRAEGLNWTVKGGLETDTADGDFGAFVGRARGIESAGILGLWRNAELIVDRFSGSESAAIKLTLHSFFDISVPRPTSFARVVFDS